MHLQLQQSANLLFNSTLVLPNPQFSLFFVRLKLTGMDKGKKPVRSGTMTKSDKIYMELREIIREHALRYLPAKSLHRFTAVCRDWKLQISTPFFEHTQSCSFRSISGLFCLSPYDPPSFISLDQMSYGVPVPELKFLPEPVDVQASSNGLLCCRGRTGDKAYYICNPVNQQWKKLPKPDAQHGSDPALVLVFEPSLLNFVADYKLICAYPSADFDDAYEFEIYSSIEDSWKISSEICFGNHGRVLQRGGVHVNGVVYWLSNTYNVSLIAFDLKKDRSTVIPCYELRGYYVLGVINGKLCALYRKGLEITVFMLSNVYANTMQMESESKTWEIRQHIFLKHADIGGMVITERSVLATGNEAIVFHDGLKIFSYNLITKETELVSTKAEFRRDYVYVPYVNSLVSL